AINLDSITSRNSDGRRRGGLPARRRNQRFQWNRVLRRIDEQQPVLPEQSVEQPLLTRQQLEQRRWRNRQLERQQQFLEPGRHERQRQPLITATRLASRG